MSWVLLLGLCILLILGSFLNDLSRIARRSYEPTDDDIMRARLRTLGIQEYKIQFEPASSSFLGSECSSVLLNVPLTAITSYYVDVGIGADYAHEWLLYDVGVSRTTVRFLLLSTPPNPTHPTTAACMATLL